MFVFSFEFIEHYTNGCIINFIYGGFGRATKMNVEKVSEKRLEETEKRAHIKFDPHDFIMQEMSKYSHVSPSITGGGVDKGESLKE